MKLSHLNSALKLYSRFGAQNILGVSLYSTIAKAPQEQPSNKVKEGEAKERKEILMLFHASGLTCNQWRKLKNLCYPGRTLFQPSRSETESTHSAGPTCALYLPEETSDKLEFFPSKESMDQQDLLLLYGKHRSNLLDHKDIEKASEFDELETSLFNFYLPSSYLSFVCSREE